MNDLETRDRASADEVQRTAGDGSADDDPASAMDPRMAERVRYVAKDSAREVARRRRRRLAIFLTVAITACGSIIAANSPLLDVDHIEVTGGNQTAADVVAAASAVELGSPMHAVDLASAEQRVESLAWVADASVRRSWPGTVEISIIERTPVAVAGSGRGRMLIDRTGRVLGPAGEQRNLPSIGDLRSEDGPGRLLRSGQQDLAGVAASVPADIVPTVIELGYGDDGIEALLDNGVLIVVGDTSQIRTKFIAVDRLFAADDPTTLARVDVSVPSLPSLTRSSGGAQ